jgi:hypothetical protein
MSSRVDKLFPTEIPRAFPESHPNRRVPPLVTQPWRSFRIMRGSLRAKFIIIVSIVSLQIALMGVVIVVIKRNQREPIIEQARLRALSLRESLAAISEGYLLSYSYIKLEQADAENRVKALR